MSAQVSSALLHSQSESTRKNNNKKRETLTMWYLSVSVSVYNAYMGSFQLCGIGNFAHILPPLAEEMLSSASTSEIQYWKSIRWIGNGERERLANGGQIGRQSSREYGWIRWNLANYYYFRVHANAFVLCFLNGYIMSARRRRWSEVYLHLYYAFSSQQTQLLFFILIKTKNISGW